MNRVRARAWGALLLAMIAVAGVSLACGSEDEGTPPAASSATSSAAATTAQQPETALMQWDAPPAMSIDTAKQYHATLHTSYGDITVELYPREVPVTVNNFVFLARQGFYDGVAFHRIVRGFMVQGGDPTGTGRGGPGYRFADEQVTRDYVRGALAMANSGPDSNGSQFFIMHEDFALPPDYTIFGMVTDGIEVVDAIANSPVEVGPGGERSLPVEQIVIRSIGISETERTTAAAPAATPAAASSDEPPAVSCPTPPAASAATQPQEADMQWDAPPAMSIDTEKQYCATLRTTHGDITVALHASEAPVTVNNFVFLARQGFYNGVRFHRIIQGFMVQSGDPTGTGRGGPGYRFADEPVTRDYLRGTLAMANAGPNTNGSQFFIVHQDAGLPPAYTIFGMVTDGLDALDAIAGVPVGIGPSGERSSPEEEVVIQSVEITEE